MAVEYYSNVNEVLRFSGIKPKDIANINDDIELNSTIETWLVQITDMINVKIEKDFTSEDSVPASIDNIATRMCNNMVQAARVNSKSPNVTAQNGYITTTLAKTYIFTDDIISELEYVKKSYNKPTINPILLGGYSEDDE